MTFQKKENVPNGVWVKRKKMDPEQLGGGGRKKKRKEIKKKKKRVGVPEAEERKWG